MADALNGAATAGRPVDVAAIERELAGLWDEPRGGAGPEPATRACMSNLLVWCATQDQARSLPAEIGAIVEKHPSRVLLLVGEEDRALPGLSASVSAVCHLAGEGRQICSEHVTLSAPRASTPRLPSTARSLLIGDLPTALWWAAPEPPPLAGGLFEDLASMADHVIYDSVGWPDPVRGVVSVASWSAGDRRNFVSDLAWRRGKPWRHLVGQTLDPRLAPGALEGIREVRIEHGPHALPQAWFLIGWLAGRLGWRPTGGKVAPGVELTWGFEAGSRPIEVTVHRLSEGDPELRSVRIAWTAGGAREAVVFGVEGPGRLVVRGEGGTPERVLAARREPRASLVARQLAKRFHDPVFEDTLALSRRMAEALLR